MSSDDAARAYEFLKLTITCLQEDRIEDALTAIRKAVRLDPAQTRYRLILARIEAEISPKAWQKTMRFRTAYFIWKVRCWIASFRNSRGSANDTASNLAKKASTGAVREKAEAHSEHEESAWPIVVEMAFLVVIFLVAIFLAYRAIGNME